MAELSSHLADDAAENGAKLGQCFVVDAKHVGEHQEHGDHPMVGNGHHLLDPLRNHPVARLVAVPDVRVLYHIREKKSVD